jgi:hypothetical protein
MVQESVHRLGCGFEHRGTDLYLDTMTRPKDDFLVSTLVKFENIVQTLEVCTASIQNLLLDLKSNSLECSAL